MPHSSMSLTTHTCKQPARGLSLSQCRACCTHGGLFLQQIPEGCLNTASLQSRVAKHSCCTCCTQRAVQTGTPVCAGPRWPMAAKLTGTVLNGLRRRDDHEVMVRCHAGWGCMSNATHLLQGVAKPCDGASHTALDESTGVRPPHVPEPNEGPGPCFLRERCHHGGDGPLPAGVPQKAQPAVVLGEGVLQGVVESGSNALRQCCIQACPVLQVCLQGTRVMIACKIACKLCMVRMHASELAAELIATLQQRPKSLAMTQVALEELECLWMQHCAQPVLSNPGTLSHLQRCSANTASP